MTVFDSLLLGSIQGLTEFLPISSSGHLILARYFLHINTQDGLAFDAVLQLGTMLAVYIYFWTDIKQLIVSAWKLIFPRGSKIPTQDRSLIMGLIIGTIPALILGLFLEHTMETLFRNPSLVTWTLFLGSFLLLAADRYATRLHENPSIKDAWWIGVFQTLALVPGMSRSGATISGGLFRGLTRDAAIRFSFLLSLPIITGSGLLKLLKLFRHPVGDINLLQLAIGTLASAVIGYLCIRWLIRYLSRHTFRVFIWYRIILAVLAQYWIIWLLPN